jgi:hypothetical protein
LVERIARDFIRVPESVGDEEKGPNEEKVPTKKRFQELKKDILAVVLPIRGARKAGEL